MLKNIEIHIKYSVISKLNGIIKNICYDDVEKYIAVNFKNSIDEDTVICNFNKLNSYFKEYKINDYEIIVMNLANTNDIIKENIQKIHNNKTNNKFINMFINYYNDLKEIEEYNNNVLLEGDNLLYSKKLLSKDEEIELGKRILLNDKDAINEMVLHNTRLAIKIAGYYVGNVLEYEEIGFYNDVSGDRARSILNTIKKTIMNNKSRKIAKNIR